MFIENRPLVALAVLPPPLATACKKDKAKRPVSIALNTKTEAEVRSLLTGGWKRHYTVIVSPSFEIRRCNNFWEMTPTDTLKQIF